MGVKRKSKRIVDDPKPKKKKGEKAIDASEQAFENDDTEHSVLGGLSGGYRITGNEPATDPTTTIYKVPFNDKFIICEHRAKDRSEGEHNDNDNDATKHAGSTPALIFTHGAGGGISNPATVSFADGFSESSPIVCFQGTMNLQSRVKTFHAMVEHENFSSALGGRSMGARAAVITANELKNKVKALVLVSYPLVGGSKGDVRDAILKDVKQDVDVLFVVGSLDGMCDMGRLNEVRGQMSAKSWLVEVKDADHGMSLKNQKVVEAVRKKTGAVAAEWLERRDENMRYCLVKWDEDEADVVVDGWTAEATVQAEVNPKSKTSTKRGK